MESRKWGNSRIRDRLRKPPRGLPWGTKQRDYGEERAFLGNYETVIGKEEALQKSIGGDLREAVVSAPLLNLNYGVNTRNFLRTP